MSIPTNYESSPTSDNTTPVLSAVGVVKRFGDNVVLRGLDLPPQRKRMICAVVGVVAFLDVPLVFLSARLWRSIHPAVFASKGGGLEPEMKLTAIACVAGMGLFWAGLVWLRTRQLGLRDRLDSLRLRAED